MEGRLGLFEESGVCTDTPWCRRFRESGRDKQYDVYKDRHRRYASTAGQSGSNTSTVVVDLGARRGRSRSCAATN